MKPLARKTDSHPGLALFAGALVALSVYARPVYEHFRTLRPSGVAAMRAALTVARGGYALGIAAVACVSILLKLSGFMEPVSYGAIGTGMLTGIPALVVAEALVSGLARMGAGATLAQEKSRPD